MQGGGRMMQAVMMDRTDRSRLVDGELPFPRMARDDLLVRVLAVSVNPADARIMQRAEIEQGIDVLGFDACGEVLSVGETVHGFRAGDVVYYAGDLSRQGSFAEYQAVRADLVGKAPKSLLPTQAAAMPLTMLTAWEILHEKFRMSGGKLLVIGGAGGVGSQLIQLARLQPEVEVVASASRPASKTWCVSLGAHSIVDHAQPLAGQLSDPVSHVALLNQPDHYWSMLPDMLEPYGEIACIVPFASPVDINALMRKSLSLHWEFMFSKALFPTSRRRARVAQGGHEPAGRSLMAPGGILNHVASLVDEGRLRSTETLCLGRVSASGVLQAMRQLASGHTIGKITFSGF